ncbi:hypothetical protein Tco_0741004 [Tanacetum coccineum]
MHTPIDFTAFAMNRLQIDNLTKADLVGPVYNLLKGTCKSYVELDITMERIIDDKKYTASTTKSKAARYELKGIEDMVPSLWSSVKVVYNRHALLGISHWRTKRQIFYVYTTKMVSKHDVRVEDLQLGVKSYQKKLNLTKLRTRDVDMSRRPVYTTLSNHKGFITCCIRMLSKFSPPMDTKTSQNRRDLPRDNPLVSVEVLRYDIKRSKSENKGIVPTEMELVLEQTQQGTSHEVSIVVMDPVTQCTTLPSHSRSLNRLLFHFSRRFTHFYRLSHSELVDIEKVAVSSSLRSLKPKRTIKSRAKRSSINLIRTLFQYTCLSHTVKTRNILRVLRIILMVLPEHPSDT